MVSEQQCKLARTLTNDTTTDSIINSEYQMMTNTDKKAAAIVIDDLLRQHDMPLDKGLRIMFADFAKVAEQYHISPATLFCVYMDWKNGHV